MEKLNIFFLAVIIVYLVYSFVKSRPPKKENNVAVEKPQKEKALGKKEVTDYEKYVVAAAVAGIMDHDNYTIKRVYLAGKEENSSSWRQAGRQESMMRRILHRKN